MQIVGDQKQLHIWDSSLSLSLSPTLYDWTTEARQSVAPSWLKEWANPDQAEINGNIFYFADSIFLFKICKLKRYLLAIVCHRMTGWSVVAVMGCIVCVSLTTTLHTRATDGREEGKWHWGRRSINIIIIVLAPEFLQKYFSFLQIFYTLEEIIANLSALIVP